MTYAISSILEDYSPTLYLYGSVVLDDFQPGWSDIDLLVLTDGPISDVLAEKLVTLRQALNEDGDNPFLELFEGGMLSKTSFIDHSKENVVYWGTGKQRITDTYRLDSFAMAELLDSGVLLRGDDIRDGFAYPTMAEFKADILHHYDAIRKYAQNTGEQVTSCGWLLDIARGLYTLRTGKIISKTAAGEWVLAENLAPNPEVLQKAIDIRKDPQKYAEDPETLTWCGTLGGYIQKFADVLESELNK
jgi:predicted nucleotidyltransferase